MTTDNTAALRSGIDASTFDADVRPQDDLFRHVNGRWLTMYEIPADRARDGAFRELHDRAEEQVRDIILEAGEQAGAAGVDPTTAKIGALYASFMDTERIAALGTAPLAADLALLDDAADKAALARALGELQRTGAAGALGLYVDNDALDPEKYVVYLLQAGLGLPDEAYYREEQHAEALAAYTPHVGPMGDSARARMARARARGRAAA